MFAIVKDRLGSKMLDIEKRVNIQWLMKGSTKHAANLADDMD